LWKVAGVRRWPATKRETPALPRHLTSSLEDVMAFSRFIEDLESRFLLSATVSPDGKRIKAPPSLDGITTVTTVDDFHGVVGEVDGYEYQVTHTKKHFSEVGLNNDFEASGKYTYSAERNTGTVHSKADGVKATTTFTFTSKHAGTFYTNYGGGVFASGTFTD
jgi:hypothetical protein